MGKHTTTAARIGAIAGSAVLIATLWMARPAADSSAAQETPPGTPAAFEDARTADLQTRVADLSTRVAELGGADSEAVAGRLGGRREGFDARFGPPVAYLGPGQVQYDVADVGRVAVTFANGLAERIAVVSPRPAELPLEQPDAADWTASRALEIAAAFAPADAVLDPAAVAAAEPAMVTSEVLGAATALPDAAGCVAAGPRTLAVDFAAPAADQIAAVELALGPPAAPVAVASGGQSNRGAGVVANTSLGGRVTANGIVLQTLQTLPGAAGVRPAATGSSWFAVEVALQNGSGRPVTFTPADFVLVGSDGAEVVAACGGLDPAFPLSEIEDGGVAEGWVSFLVPDGFDPSRVVILAPNARVGFDF